MYTHATDPLQRLASAELDRHLRATELMIFMIGLAIRHQTRTLDDPVLTQYEENYALLIAEWQRRHKTIRYTLYPPIP